MAKCGWMTEGNRYSPMADVSYSIKICGTGTENIKERKTAPEPPGWM